MKKVKGKHMMCDVLKNNTSDNEKVCFYIRNGKPITCLASEFSIYPYFVVLDLSENFSIDKNAMKVYLPYSEILFVAMDKE